MEGFGWFGEFVGGESRVGRGEMGCGGKGVGHTGTDICSDRTFLLKISF